MKCEGCGTIESGSYRYYERKWFCLFCYRRYKSGDTRYIPSEDSAFLKMTEQAISNDEAVIKGSRNVRHLIRPIPMGETVPEVSNISALGSKVADLEFVTKDWVERLPAQTLEDARNTRWDPCSCGSGKKYGKCCKKVSAVERLINILSYGNSEDKTKAVIALGDTQDGRAVKPLILALGTYDSSISKEAFYALQYIGKTATKSLIRAIKGKDVNIRIQIIRILGNIGDNRALIPLIRLLEDRDENVRIEAAKALGSLSWRPVTIIEKVYFFGCETRLGNHSFFRCASHRASNWHIGSL